MPKHTSYFLSQIVLFVLLLIEHANAGSLFWADHGNVYRSDLNGNGKVKIYDATLGAAGWVEVDAMSQKLYLRTGVDVDGGSGGLIRRMNYDGSALENIITGLNFSAYGLGIDTVNGKMYFGDHPLGIFQANLDGTGKSPFPNTTSGFDLHYYPHDIEVSGGKVYYSNAGQMFLGTFLGIRRSDLDGTNVQTIVNHGSVDTNTILMAIDANAGKLYWSDWSEFQERRINRSNLDGTGLEVFMHDIAAYDLEIDPIASKLYFTGLNFLGRINLDGSGLEQLAQFDGNYTERGLAVLPDSSPVPEPTMIVGFLCGVIGLGRRIGRKDNYLS